MTAKVPPSAASHHAPSMYICAENLVATAVDIRYFSWIDRRRPVGPILLRVASDPSHRCEKCLGASTFARITVRPATFNQTRRHSTSLAYNSPHVRTEDDDNLA